MIAVSQHMRQQHHTVLHTDIIPARGRLLASQREVSDPPKSDRSVNLTSSVAFAPIGSVVSATCIEALHGIQNTLTGSFWCSVGTQSDTMAATMRSVQVSAASSAHRAAFASLNPWLTPIAHVQAKAGARPSMKASRKSVRVVCSAQKQEVLKQVSTAAAAAALATVVGFGNVEAAYADIAGLTPCSESKAFAKRQKQELKTLNKRLKQVRISWSYCCRNPQAESSADVQQSEACRSHSRWFKQAAISHLPGLALSPENRLRLFSRGPALSRQHLGRAERYAICSRI